MIHTPRKTAQQERVGIREREDVIRGAKAHGAGAASPKERQARPGADVLTSFEVEDDDRDPNWDGESTTASPRGARALRLLPVPIPQSSDALPMPQSSDALPVPQSRDSLPVPQSSDALHMHMELDALSELTWPTPSPPPPEMRNAAVGGPSGWGVFGSGSGGGAFDEGSVSGGAFDAGSVGVARQQSAAPPAAGLADIAPAPSGDRCAGHRHCGCERCLREDNVSRPRWRTIVVPPSPPSIPQADDQQLHRHGGVEEGRSGPGAEGQPASSSILAPRNRPFVVPQVEADDYPTRILRALLLLLLALVSIVSSIHLFSFLSRLHAWSMAHAQATAQKLDVLYAVADNVTVVLGLALYVPIFLAQLGIAQIPNILSASAVLGVYVLWKKWGSGVYVLWKKWLTRRVQQ